MFDWIEDLYIRFAAWVFEGAVIPALYAIGMMDFVEDAQQWLDFAIFGLMAIVIIYCVCRPLEAWRPVERWEGTKAAIRTDVFYTVLARLGIFPMIAFVLFASVQAWWEGSVAETGFVPPTIETLFPWLRDHALVALLIYILVLDFAEYCRHRFQHRFGWWWALHSVHHSQEKMTFWTDDRNHILDDIIAAFWFGGIALVIGVPPGQFPVVFLVLRLAESLSHANVRLSYGWLGERLLVSPRFHRAHHGVLSIGEHGKNYGVLFPFWDWMFGTADFRRDVFPRTGDPTAPDAMVHGGWVRQQVAGFRRMVYAIRAG